MTAGHAPCLVCGGPVERRPDERPCNWHRRKACSRTCKRRLLAVAGAKSKGGRGPHLSYSPGWPEFTGSELRGRCFAAHNLPVKPDLRPMPLPPPTLDTGISPIEGGAR
jgi:hypothetical protein